MRTNDQGFWQEFKEIAHSLLNENIRVCNVCEKPLVKSNIFCEECQAEFFYPELQRCMHCGKIGVRQRLCRDCAEGKGPTELVKVAAFGHYTGAWREFVQGIKFKAQPYLLKKISSALADYAMMHLPPPNYLVPVPMHKERLAERGFNQAEVIASLLHWELGIPLWRRLERVQATTPQVGLGRKERLHNLEKAFQIKASPQELKQIKGAIVWIVDDVITTGATMDHCAKELKRGGVTEVYGFVLAAGMEKGN
jgi:competence protein ComFC